MQNSATNTIDGHEINSQTKPPKFTKRIGGTTYTVSVHFSQTSKETVEDKLLRLIENEVRKSA